MKKLLFIGVVFWVFVSSLLLAQEKIIIKYNDLLKQYEYSNSSGLKFGSSKYNNLLKETEHYDSYGKKIGETKYNDLLKEYDTYNSYGEKESTTKYNTILGQYEHYDNFGKKKGTTKYNNLLKQYDIYDSFGKKIGEIKNIGINDLSLINVVEITNNDVFGILLLPSISKIIFNPNHKKIKEIKNLSPDKQKKEGWIKSK